MQHFRRKSDKFVLANFIFLLGAYCVVMYWMFFPYHVLEIYNIPFPASQTIQGGHYVTYTSKYCVFDSVPATVYQTLVAKDGAITLLTTKMFKLPVGCHTNDVNVYIPVGLEPQEYKIVNVGEWQVNPIRRMEFHSETQFFTVTK